MEARNVHVSPRWAVNIMKEDGMTLLDGLILHIYLKSPSSKYKFTEP